MGWFAGGKVKVNCGRQGRGEFRVRRGAAGVGWIGYAGFDDTG